MLCLWSAKGGSGCTVTSAAVGVLAAGHHETLLVDLAGDTALALGLPASEPPTAVAVGETGRGHDQPDRASGQASGRGCDDGAASGWGIAGWLQAPSPPPDALARFERTVRPGLSLLPWGLGPPLSSPSAWSPAWLAERVAILARLLGDDERRVVVDLGLGVGGLTWWQEPFLDQARASVLVTRGCYLSLSRCSRHCRRPDGVVLIEEPGRALTAADVVTTLGVPVLAAVPCEPAVARAVDAGLLLRRLPRSLRRLQPLVDGQGVQW